MIGSFKFRYDRTKPEDPIVICLSRRAFLLRDSPSSPKIRFGEIDKFVRPSAHHRLQHVESKTLRHLHVDGGRYRELAPMHHGIDQHGSVMREGGRDSASTSAGSSIRIPRKPTASAIEPCQKDPSSRRLPFIAR